jgi:hypothetical protein
METSQSGKKITVSHVFAWIFGILFLLGGLGTMASNVLGGIFIIGASLFLLPPSYEFIRARTKINFTKGVRILIAVAFLGIGTVFANPEGYKESYVEPLTDKKDEMVKEEKTEEPSATEKLAEAKQTTTSSEAPKQEAVSSATLGEKQALSSAKKYLDYSAFSRKGLIKQLEFEGFSNQEAIYAVDNINTDWNAQAAISAKKYLEYTSFSRSGLIQQLEFEGYTSQQAEYGASAVGY